MSAQKQPHRQPGTWRDNFTDHMSYELICVNFLMISGPLHKENKSADRCVKLSDDDDPLLVC